MSVASLTRHVPVLLDEVIAVLAPASGETMVDATYGAGTAKRALAEIDRRLGTRAQR